MNQRLADKKAPGMTIMLGWLGILCLGACVIDLPLPAAAQQQEHVTPIKAASGFQQEMMASMEKMDRDMLAEPMTGDPNHDFTAMMIPHHQGAIDMAKAYLLHGQDPILRRLAQEIIVTQQQEIELMRLRLAAIPTSAAAPLLSKQPATAAAIAPSGKDRVYTADQTSNTVSVIDPASNKLLGVIRLGVPLPGAL